MIKYNNKIIAEAGHYLDGDNRIGICLPYNGETEYQEIAINNDVKPFGDNKFLIGNFFVFGKDNIKKTIMDMMFTTDDQIAIILNKDGGNTDQKAIYKLMQDWRKWAHNIHKKIESLE